MRPKHLATPCPASSLSLPLELRQQVYRHLLPTTYLRNASSLEWGAQSLVPVWLKGNTSVLRVNHKFYSEAIELLFGDATFALAIYHDWVDFCFRTLRADGSVKESRRRFCKPFGVRNLHRIRRLHIRVRASARDLSNMNDLVEQVEFVCRLLRTIPRIINLHVVYQAWNLGFKCPSPRTVLKSFSTLDNVNDARIDGSLDKITKLELESVLQGSYNR